MTVMHNPVHPGVVLQDWIEDLTQVEVADAIGLHRTTLSRILNGHAAITAEVDVRLSEALGTSPGFWTTMQAQFDLAAALKARRKVRVRPLIQHEERLAACA